MITKLMADFGELNGYSVEAAARKDIFLRTAKAFLASVGKEINRYGLNEISLHINRGGMAGSGEVTAHYWASGSSEAVYVHIASSVLGANRPDHLFVLARIEQITKIDKVKGKPVVRVGKMGINQYPRVDEDATTLTRYLARLLGIEITNVPVRVETKILKPASVRVEQLQLF
jgi:hypothetical protein